MKTLPKVFALAVVAVATLLAPLSLPAATHLMENLGRGVVALRTADTESFVSWRMLGTDPDEVAFNVYRQAGAATPVLVNAAPLAGATSLADLGVDFSQATSYFVRPVIGGLEQGASVPFTLPANAPVQPYLRLPLDVPPPGAGYTYSPNDTSIGDLDGDGEYELIVKWDPSNAQDNSNDGVTGNVYLDGYKLDGTLLWRIDLGVNIRAGAHYTQFLVYDFDGDGKAELVCKTAPGTRDGTGTFIAQPGKFVGTPSAPIDHNADFRNAAGYILTGPEFFTIFHGETGAELATTNYVVPRNANPASDNVTAWGDDYGNRVDRFLAGVAYLDGRRPSFVLCRGYYTRAVLAAWDWRDGRLTQRWVFDTGNEGTASPFAAWRGQGAHSLTVGDVDGDGRDEITYGAAAIDDDGSGLYSTLLGHGDAEHLSDMDPTRPGQEIWMVHESPGSYGPTGLEFRDARTGALIFGLSGQGADVGRGVAGDIDPRFLGYEMWGSRGGLMATTGVEITPNRPGQMNFMSWWDGDLLRELLDGVTISKWDWNTNTSSPLLQPAGVSSNNSTKANPSLSADFLGDWREELVVRENTNDALRIYTTTVPTTHRLRTLVHDRQYRLAIAWQNVGYNQPPHPSFYLGEGMAAPAAPDIVTSLAALGTPAPAVSSVNRYDPLTAGTGATSVVFRVTFNVPVTDVDASDFAVSTSGAITGTVATVTALSGVAYNVTVGSITGTGTLRLDVLPGGIAGPGGAPLATGFTDGQIYNRATLAWLNQASGGLWSNPANWDGGVIAHGVGAVPIFGNFDLAADNTVVLDTPRTLSGLSFGDTNPATPASWVLADGGNAGNLLTLDTLSGVPTATVAALGTGATATLNVTLGGADGLAKAGPGTLVLTQPAALTGQVNVTGGTLRLAPGASLAASTVSVSAGGGTLEIAGGTFTASGATTVNGNGGSLIVNAGTATFAAVGSNNTTNNLIRVNGGNFSASSIAIQRSSDATPNYVFGFVVTGGTATVNGPVGIGTNNSWGSMSVEGGSVTASGAITVGNLRDNSARGGQLRVTGGTLATTDATDGLVLVRGNSNNSNANFLGGITHLPIVKFGFNNTVTAGSGTLTVNGGALYLGSGGLVRLGAGSFTSTINLQSGLLGASADWSSVLPVTLPAGGNIAIKAADATDNPFDITLAGDLSGPGGFTKTGLGTLTLAGANTYAGTTTVNAGTLQVAGSLTSTIVINETGALAGSGNLNVPVTLNAGGALRLGGSAPDVLLGLDQLIWTGGGSIALDLGANGSSDRLVLAGALARGAPGSFAFAFNPGDGFAAGNVYTLATFGSSDFSAGDFVATGLPAGFAAKFSLHATGLDVTIVGTPFITSADTAAATYGLAFGYVITAGNVPENFSASGLPAGLEVDSLTGVISGIPEETGTFNVVLGASNLAGTDNAILTLTVAKAAAVLTLDNLKQYYDGTPREVTATTSPTGLDVSFTYDGQPSAPTLPGTYPVIASINDANYQGTASGTLAVRITALVRHAPAFNGDVDGSIQVLLPESVTLNSSSSVSHDLLVPGRPGLRLNGSPTFVGTLDQTGAATPTNHLITLNSGAVLRYAVRRVDALALPVVPAPDAPTGTRSVSVNNATTPIGSFATLRNLTLNSGAGFVAVPPGAYGNFTANSGGFILGTAGADTPSVYHLQRLTLNGSARLQVAGPVIVRLASGLTLQASAGASDHADWLVLEFAGGGLTLNNGGVLHGHVVAPGGTVTINGNATLHGTVTSDRLTLNSNGLLSEPTD